MKISCPYCGARDEREFRCGGQTHISRPGPAEKLSDAAWADYLYFRDNPRGWHFERWCHAAGCGQWFNMVRHTLTHEIRIVYKRGDPRPEVEP
jgi:sarcosine oxidase subunit delta